MRGFINLVLCRLAKEREIGAFAMSQVIIGASAAFVIVSGVVTASYYWEHNLAPDYSQAQAQTTAQDVATQIRAGVEYDSSQQGKLNAAGTKTWNKTVVVDNQNATATITFTPNGAIGEVDVTLNGKHGKAYVSLTSESVMPGSVIGS